MKIAGSQDGATVNLCEEKSLTIDSSLQWQPVLPPHLVRKPRDIPGVTREKKKPGPKPNSYRMKLYLLPPGREIPQLTKNDPLIQEYQDMGYGRYSESKYFSIMLFLVQLSR